MNGIVYSFAKPEDENNVRELLKRSGLPDEDIHPHFHNFMVAWSGSILVGCIGLERTGDSALLRSLAVLEEFRHHGIALELCKRLSALAISLGYDSLYLLTETAETYFNRIGYRKIDRSNAPPGIQQTEQFRSLCPSSAILMVLQELGSDPVSSVK